MYEIKNRYEIDTFIRNVFNYYNGRINVVNSPARLHIEWLQCNKSTAGTSLLPNIVEIYPNVMCRVVYNEEQLKRWIIMVIIHELYHTDQIIITSKLNDKNYVNYIENAVEVMTTIYLGNHRQEIYNVFGVLINDSNNLREYMYNYISGSGNYRRNSIVDHIFLCLCDIIRTDKAFINELFEVYYRYIESDKNIVLFVERDKYIYVKYNNDIIDIKIFNDFMYDNYFRFELRKTKITFFEEDSELHICIGNNHLCNNMIEII